MRTIVAALAVLTLSGCVCHSTWFRRCSIQDLAALVPDRAPARVGGAEIGTLATSCTKTQQGGKADDPADAVLLGRKSDGAEIVGDSSRGNAAKLRREDILGGFRQSKGGAPGLAHTKPRTAHAVRMSAQIPAQERFA